VSVTVALGNARKWPPYVSGFLNFANRTSQITRVKNVGSTSQLFREFRQTHSSGVTSVHDWRAFYEQHTVNDEQTGAEALQAAGAKLYAQVEKIRAELSNITPQDCVEYVDDLVINKSFAGHGIEEAMLRKIAEKTNRTFTPSTLDDERKGVDGYLDAEPVSVKPASYRAGENPHDNLPAKIYYYALTENDVKTDQLLRIADGNGIHLPSTWTKKQMWDTLTDGGNILFWEN